MSDSFRLLRKGIVTLQDDDDDILIEESDEESSSPRSSLPPQRIKNGLTTVVVPASDSDDSTEEPDIMDSPILAFKKKTGKKIILDSESEEEELTANNPAGDRRTTDEEDGNDTIFMSRSNRLSIFGIANPDASSDESDILVSEGEDVGDLAKQAENERESDHSDSTVSLSEMAPNPGVQEFWGKSKLQNNSVVDMSIDLTQEIKADVSKMSIVDDDCAVKIIPNDVEVERIEDKFEEEDVQIIQNEQPVIHISSDDEFPDLKINTNGSSNFTSTPVQAKIKQFFQRDVTRPGANVIYVTKKAKEEEINKLNEMKNNLEAVKKLLDSLVLKTLPDHGVRLGKRKEELENGIRAQKEKISNMIVENQQPELVQPKLENPSLLSWEDLQAGSSAVQPRTFGAQALNTHNTQKTITLDRLGEFHKSLDTLPDESQLAEPPRTLVTPLMVHQLYALTWLTWREKQKPRGGILADDMGLGKTLTMIALIVHSKENNIEYEVDSTESNKKFCNGGTLVVCPASLLKQWFGEIQHHCKKYTIKAEIHHGAKREIRANKLAMNDVVITTYNLVQRDHEKSGALMRVKWQRVILDEAHIVRNHKSLTAKAVTDLSAATRWCLTGTPVHNKELDLFALLKFLHCDPFDDLFLWKKWIDNKTTGGQARLMTIMKALLLRRTKLQLQENKTLGCLPNKNTYMIEVKLSTEEMKVYQKVLQFSKSLFAKFLQQRLERRTGYDYMNAKELLNKVHKKVAALHGGREIKSHEILVLLLRLRQICCHPGLIHSMLDDEQYESETQNNDSAQMDILNNLTRMNISADLSDSEQPDNPIMEAISVANAVSQIMASGNPIFQFDNKSAKIEAVISCLQENVPIHEGDKAIIVSQWTGMLEVVEKHIKRLGFECSTLSGKIPVTARHDIIKEFNNPKSKIQILLLSLCAGGVGLNLIGANHLLLVDLHWNPQLEAQAQDRIYRVGQKKPVHIYKFMCMETVEQSIKVLQDKKLALAENVLTGVKALNMGAITIEDMKFLFNIQHQ